MKKFLILIIVCSLALPILGRTELPLDKLALYMSFDNVSGDTVKDESKNGNNGKIVKASAAKGKGKYGDAMEFNGRDSHVLIKNSDSLSISGEVTISVWVNWNDAPGDGWLAVQDAGGNEAYTRRGDLQIDGNGVLTSGGRPVLGDGGPIAVPLEAKLAVGGDGTISAIGAGQNPDAIVNVGRLKLVSPGDAGLTRGEDGLFRAGPNGQPQVLGRDEDVRVASGALEGSNVSAIESMVSMIDTARRFEMQMKVISSADENAQRATSLLSLS